MQTATPQRPHRRKTNRKPVILIAIIALVVIAALVTALLLINGNNNQPYPVRDTMIPGAQMRTLETPQAMRYDLSTAEAAQAYFGRLLDSEYIGLHGETAQTPQPDGDGWSVAEENADGTTLTAAFDQQGIITSLSVNASLRSGMKASSPQYRLGYGDESLFTYLRTFAYEYLPDVAVISGVIAADEYNDTGRFITVLADSQSANSAFEFVVQIDPEIRIVGFRTLVDDALAFVRTSRMAQAEGETGETEDTAETDGQTTGPVTSNTAVQLARDALVQALGFDASEVANFVLVDISWYSDETDGDTGLDSEGYYVVSFRLPESDEAIYSDYAVFVDEATGEILRILDPSNISNG